ncbi:hypothetical protein [Paralcaligenes ginsengisoli]
MLDDSLFVSATVHEREVDLPDGKKHTLYFKELPAVEFRKFGLAEKSEDEVRQSEAIFRLVAASLCEPDGAPALTFEKALTLKGPVLNALTKIILEINGSGKQGNA